MAGTSPQKEFEKYKVDGAYHWKAIRPSWKTTFNPYLAARYSVALSHLPAPAGKANAADLGCGDGYIAIQMARMGYSVTGVDGSADAVRLARAMAEKHPVAFTEGDVCHTPVPDASVDLAISLDVIEHLPDPIALLREMKRITKPGGHILVGTPIRFTEKPLDKYHVHEFFADEFAALLKEHFSVERLVQSHPLEHLLKMRKKHSLAGIRRNIGWNWINLKCLLSGRNPFAQENGDFPTYMLAVCRR